MKQNQSQIELIIRGGKWGVQINVTEFPVICPSCENYFPELYQHSGSRYGQVGSLDCQCGETVYLTDNDNIIEYIKCHSNDKSITIDFKKLFRLTIENFKEIKDKYGLDIYQRHLNNRLSLAHLISEIENEMKVKAAPIDSNIPLPESVKKWRGLLENESTTMVIHNKGFIAKLKSWFS